MSGASCSSLRLFLRRLQCFSRFTLHSFLCKRNFADRLIRIDFFFLDSQYAHNRRFAKDISCLQSLDSNYYFEIASFVYIYEQMSYSIAEQMQPAEETNRTD